MAAKNLKGLGKRDPIEFVQWMEGYCDGFDDLPDGAWQNCCMDGVEVFNKEYKTQIDPHDGWMFWLKNRERK